MKRWIAAGTIGVALAASTLPASAHTQFSTSRRQPTTTVRNLPTPTTVARRSTPTTVAPTTTTSAPRTSPTTAAPSPTTVAPTTSTTAPTTGASATAVAATSGNPLAGRAFYVPTGQAWDTAVAADIKANPAAAVEDKIAQNENAIWLTGESDPTAAVRSIVAAAGASVPVFVVYAIPNRDCSSYSSGGVADASAYQTYADEVASGLGTSTSVVIMEPDALADTASGQCADSSRYTMIADAVQAIHAADPDALLYLDIGHVGWLTPAQAAATLAAAGAQYVRGFSLDVSGSDTAASEQPYGDAIAAIDGLHYVLDTSRNGTGPSTQTGAPSYGWCNAPGLGLGVPATVSTGDAYDDAFLWVKTPGQSDGDCAPGEPPSGDWYSSYALGLAQRAAF